MTRKDYILIAGALAEAHAWAMRLTDGRDEHGNRGFGPQPAAGIVSFETIKLVADALQKDNPKFDRDRFIKAVKGED